MFNKDSTLTDYQLDAYTGEQDFILDASYNISPSLITKFDLVSSEVSSGKEYKIKAIYIGDVSRIATDTVIMYCHGNKWHMDFYWQRAKLLAHVNGKNTYGVLMIDYRGYGASEGQPTENGLFEDVNAALEWLKAYGLSSQRLVMYGFSLGSAPVCKLSAGPDVISPAKIILEAPFAGTDVMVQDATTLNMPADYFTTLKVNNAELIRSCKMPLLWIHGTNDNFLSYHTHGEVVYKNHGGTFRKHEAVEGADHGDVPLKMGFTSYLKSIGDFIRK